MRVPVSAWDEDSKLNGAKRNTNCRSQTVEPVFGQIKAAMGIYGFMRRGMDAVRSEWKLICSCHNLMKLFRAFGVVPTT